MPDAPTVSVVMPVYNGERFLAEAIDSILGQTFKDLELIVVDDGSVDGTPAILSDFERRERRVSIHRHARNQGISATRNQGCRQARGSFIAVMDADDISLPSRLETQVAFLRSHPDIAAVGGWVQCVDEAGRRAPLTDTNYPTEPALVAWLMMFFNTMAHSTLMIRRECVNLDEVYNRDYSGTEDYDLLMRLSHVARIVNLPEVLVLYRVWSGNVSRDPRLHEQAIRVARNALSTLGVEISIEQAAALQGLSRDRFPNTSDAIQSLADAIVGVRKMFHARIVNTANDRRLVDDDCATKLWLLGVLAARHSPVLAASLAAGATRIRPLSFVHFAARILRRLRSAMLTRPARSPA